MYADLDGTVPEKQDLAVVLHRVCDIMGGSIKGSIKGKEAVTLKRDTIRREFFLVGQIFPMLFWNLGLRTQRSTVSDALSHCEVE